MRLFVFISLLLFSCNKKKPEPTPDIFSLKEMGDLATVEYTVTKIIKANDNKTWFKIGDRKILMSCEAYIKAGIDMTGLTQNNFAIDGKNIKVVLPNPTIISLSLPPDKIKVQYEDVGLFRDPFKTEERDKLAAQGENQIRNSINSLGILQQAKVNTSAFVSGFLKRLGYQNISIVYSNNPPAANQ